MTPQPTLRDLAKMIDHSLLHPTMTDAQVEAGCHLARKYDVATVCVKPYSTPQAKALLAGSSVGICTVAGFPHGNSHTRIKQDEAALAIREGATEIDVVVNNGKVLGGAWDEVKAELRAVNDTTVSGGAILKVIFENDYLKDEQIVRLCAICTELGIAFVKTSSGYGFVKLPDGNYNYRGATDPQLALMRASSGPRVQIKAAGGVRTLDDLLRVRALGVTRIGATATDVMLDEARKRGYA